MFAAVPTEKVGKFLGSREILGAEGALFRFEMKSRKSGAGRAPKGKGGSRRAPKAPEEEKSRAEGVVGNSGKEKSCEKKQMIVMLIF